MPLKPPRFRKGYATVDKAMELTELANSSRVVTVDAENEFSDSSDDSPTTGRARQSDRDASEPQRAGGTVGRPATRILTERDESCPNVHQDRAPSLLSATISLSVKVMGVGLGVLLILWLSTTSRIVSVPTPNRRNVLMVIFDDMRPVHTAYGQNELGPWPVSFTPNLDTFSEEALTFTRAYAQVSLCSPSRSSFLTGLRPDKTKVWNLVDDIRTVNTVDGKFYDKPIVTLPEYLKFAGMTTNSFGKVFHAAKPLNNDYPVSWSDYKHVMTTVTCKESCGGKNWGTGTRRQLTFHSIEECLLCPSHDAEDTFEDNDALHKAVTSLKNHVSEHGQDAPFFYVLGICKPHTPFRYPARFADRFPTSNVSDLPLPFTAAFPEGASKWEWIYANEIMTQINLDSADTRIDNETIWKIRAGYYNAAAFADEVFGSMLSVLTELGVRNNTAVIVFSDHGFHLGEQNMFAKRTLFERGTQVPFMISSPWHPRTANMSTAAVIELLDVAPTILDLVGVLEHAADPDHGPMDLDGHSLVPLMDKIQAGPDDLTGYVKEIESAEDEAAWTKGGVSDFGTGVAFSQYARCGQGGTVDCDKTQRSHFTYMGYAVRTSKWRYCEWYLWNRSSLTPNLERGPQGADLFNHSLSVHENVATDTEIRSVMDDVGSDSKVVMTLSQLLADNFDLVPPMERGNTGSRLISLQTIPTPTRQ